MFVLNGYFDESGALEDSPGIFCISGYFIQPEPARLMDKEWGDVLSAYQIPYFHMVDCAHGDGIFKHIDKEKRIELVKTLIALIKKYTTEGFSLITRADTYESRTGAPDAYSSCVDGCVTAVRNFLQMNRVDGNIAYFFEKGHKNRHAAYQHVAEKLQRESDLLTFASKTEVRLLQAADLLAWQSSKYAKDYFYARMAGDEPKRAPRKDFQSLMEHGHIFAYMGAPSDKNIMGVELWPVNRRGQTTTHLSMKKSFDIKHWTDGADPTPVIPVEGTIGYRPAGSQFTYIAFKNLGSDKVFALAFDEPRLFESISIFLQATANYEDSKNLPVVSAENIIVEEISGNHLMKIKLQGGATIGVHLSDEALAKLKSGLK